MASSASSLHYLSLTPQTLSLSKPNTSISSLSFPFSTSLKLSLSSNSISSLKPFFESRFVRNVAVNFDQVENDFDSDEDDEVQEKSFSPEAKLFVGNLPFSVDSAALAGLFERAGNVEMVEVIYDKITGRSRGFAFITMATPQEAEAAAQQFNGYELDGRMLRVNSGPPPPKRENSFGGRENSYGGRENSYGGRENSYGSRGNSSYGGRENSSYGGRENSYGGSREGSSFRGGARENSSFRGGARGGGSDFNNSNRVYVGNLSWGVDDRALETLFNESGRVVEAKVVMDRETGRSRGFGFVTYGSAEEVNSAIEALDGADLDGRSIRVNAAEARQRREF